MKNIDEDVWGLRADWCKANNLSSYDPFFWKCSLIGVQQNITYDELIKKYDGLESQHSQY